MTSQQEADLMLVKRQLDRVAFARIAEIDAMFDMATGWGSWMVMCANEREYLVNAINSRGGHAVHRYQARTSSGGRTN